MRKNKRLLLIAIGALSFGTHALDRSALAGNPVNQLGRLVGAGWSDGYHARKVDKYRLGENLPPHSSAQSGLHNTNHQRYVHQYQSQAPSPAFGCTHCNGSSVGSYQYAPSISGSIQHWQPSDPPHGPQWDGYEQPELEPFESQLTQPAMQPQQANEPQPATEPKAANEPKPAEQVEPLSPSDDKSAAKDESVSDNLPAPSTGDDELLEEALLEQAPAKQADPSEQPVDDSLLEDSLLDDGQPTSSDEDDDLLLDPADKALSPDLDASNQAKPSPVVRTVATRIPRASLRTPRKIADDSRPDRREESNRPRRLPSSFR